MATHTRRLRCIHRRMSFAAFDRLPRQLGWRYEYHDGFARVWPASVFVPFEFDLSKSSVDGDSSIRKVMPGDAAALRRGFADAFRSAPEYADRTNECYAEECEKY